MGGQLLRMEAASLVLAVVEEVAMEPPLLLDGLVSMRVLLVNLPPVNQRIDLPKENKTINLLALDLYQYSTLWEENYICTSSFINCFRSCTIIN
jgi:hypothetical protein